MGSGALGLVWTTAKTIIEVCMNTVSPPFFNIYALNIQTKNLHKSLKIILNFHINSSKESFSIAEVIYIRYVCIIDLSLLIKSI